MSGSRQLRAYRIARRDGASVADACALSGIAPSEAALIERDDAKYPPGPECFEPLNPAPAIGHNSKGSDVTDIVGADQLRLFIERIERLEEEKRGIADDIKDVMSEAKANGYDTKAIRQIIAIRRKKREQFQEEQAILETYMAALGMLAGTPLGDYALSKAPPPADATPVEQELYGEAVELVVSSQKASVSWLQRQLRVGYNAAARMVEQMEREGIVSAPNHIGAREVLRTHDSGLSAVA